MLHVHIERQNRKCVLCVCVGFSSFRLCGYYLWFFPSKCSSLHSSFLSIERNAALSTTILRQHICVMHYMYNILWCFFLSERDILFFSRLAFGPTFCTYIFVCPFRSNFPKLVAHSFCSTSIYRFDLCWMKKLHPGVWCAMFATIFEIITIAYVYAHV